MVKHKLAPVEPTLDMIDAGIDATTVDITEKTAAWIYEAMIAAAPAVQGEPVGWYTEDHFDDKSATTYSAEVAQRWRDKGWPVWPLYTTPQPAEQQAATEVESRLFSCWAVYDSEQGLIKMDPDNDCLALFDTEKGAAAVVRTHPGAAYKKLVLYRDPRPAPDTALLEAFDAGRRAAQAEAADLAGALDGMIKAADVASWGGYFPATAVTRAVEALAAYRKQETNHDNQ